MHPAQSRSCPPYSLSFYFAHVLERFCYFPCDLTHGAANPIYDWPLRARHSTTRLKPQVCRVCYRSDMSASVLITERKNYPLSGKILSALYILIDTLPFPPRLKLQMLVSLGIRAKHEDGNEFCNPGLKFHANQRWGSENTRTGVYPIRRQKPQSSAHPHLRQQRYDTSAVMDQVVNSRSEPRGFPIIALVEIFTRCRQSRLLIGQQPY